VSATGAHSAAEAQGGSERAGRGGAARPFPDPDELILEAIAERIAAEVEARSQFCPWCLTRLTNCSGFCNDICRDGYAKLMPPPMRGRACPSAARVVQRRRDLAMAAAWAEAHGRGCNILDPPSAAGKAARARRVHLAQAQVRARRAAVA
jgi:hypothetical protein